MALKSKAKETLEKISEPVKTEFQKLILVSGNVEKTLVFRCLPTSSTMEALTDGKLIITEENGQPLDYLKFVPNPKD